MNSLLPRTAPIRRVGAIVAVAGLTLALSGCVESGRTATDASTEKTPRDCPWEADTSVTAKARIAWQAIPNADVVVKDLGLLEACMPNATITWQQASSGGDVVQYYGADQVDLGLMGSSPATIASSKPVNANVDLSVVWVHDVIGEAESLIVKDSAVTDITGLAGKTVAVPFSSTAHYSLLQALAEAGLDSTRDVKLINLEPEKMVAAWNSSQIDAAWVWDPVQSELTEAGGTLLLSSADTAAAGRPTYDVGTASTTFVAEHPDFLAQWAKAQDHAIGLIQDDPAAAAESVAAVLGIDPAAAQKQFAGFTYLRAADQVEQLENKIPDDLTTTAGFLFSQGGIEEAGPTGQYRDHVDATAAKAAAHG